jgi:pimeloyl-ACP methyl ester carboxylesterase
MPRIPLAVPSLSDIPELTNQALEAARWNPRAGCLIDRVEAGCPLLVSFSSVDWTQPPAFEFFGRTRKLESRFRVRFNRVLIRDPLNAWYHRGVPGLGSHVDEVAASLRSLVDAIRPESVTTIGQSMGGYAAILFGLLLQADRMVAFGPLAHLDPDDAARYGDRRFLPVLESLRADPPASIYDDLPRLSAELNHPGELHVVFGTHPGHDDGVSGNLDAIHAFRLAARPDVTLYPYPGSDHPVVKWLVDHQQADDLLARLLLPTDEFAWSRPAHGGLART